MHEILVSTVVLAGIAAGCATPLPVVRLEPQGSDVVWASGRAVVARASDGVRTAAAFDHQNGNTVAFRVEVQNDSQARVDIDPKEMLFATCVSETNCSGRQPVTDPERALLVLDQLRAREEANGKDAASAGTALILLGVTADIASAVKGNTDEVGEQTAFATITADSVVNASDRRLDRIDAEREMWSIAVLRRTTLFPGQGAAGLVYVPLSPEAKYVWLNVSVANRDFWFPFQQAVFGPPPAKRRPRPD